MHHNVKSIQNIKAYTSLQLIQISIRVPSILCLQHYPLLLCCKLVFISCSVSPPLAIEVKTFLCRTSHHHIQYPAQHPARLLMMLHCCSPSPEHRVTHRRVRVHLHQHALGEPGALGGGGLEVDQSVVISALLHGRCVSEESDYHIYFYCA